MAMNKNDWFSIIVLIVALITFATGIVGVVYLDNLLRGTTTGALSKTAVESLLAMNIVIAVLAFVLLIWSIWRMVMRARKYELGKTNVVVAPPMVPRPPAPTSYAGLGMPSSFGSQMPAPPASPFVI